MKESLVADNIRKIIDEKGYKQSAVAERAGISKQTFSNMLNGRKIIDEHAISGISRALGIKPNDLFGITPKDKTA